LKIFENFGKIEKLFTDVQRGRGKKKICRKKKWRFLHFFFLLFTDEISFLQKKKAAFFSEGLYGPLGGGGGAHFFPKFWTTKNHAKISKKKLMKNCKKLLCMSISM
jgi:hypothetical protein